jgi:hypothetical protein
MQVYNIIPGDSSPALGFCRITEIWRYVNRFQGCFSYSLNLSVRRLRLEKQHQTVKPIAE